VEWAAETGGVSGNGGWQWSTSAGGAVGVAVVSAGRKVAKGPWAGTKISWARHCSHGLDSHRGRACFILFNIRRISNIQILPHL
jgi:hypothetical protein